MRVVRSVLIAILGLSSVGLGSVACGPALAQAAAAVAPMEIPGARTVDSKGVIKLFEAHGDALKIVDNRRAEDFDAGHIEGAVRILDTDLTEARMAEIARKEDRVLFYCNGLACGRAAKAAAMAVGWGYREVHYFALGMDEWKKLGLPLVK